MANDHAGLQPFQRHADEALIRLGAAENSLRHPAPAPESKASGTLNIDPATNGPQLATDTRRHIATELFINNHKFGDDNGCATAIPPSGQSTCGHPGHVSEVTWKFLRTDGDGDVYQITRRYPSDVPSAKSDTKEITYTGKSLILWDWEDDTQKIILRPKP